MEPVIVWYLRMSVIYFAAGALAGFYMIINPEVSGYFVTAHAHLNLLGFMSMMIYGVGYHILPRFSGQHIYSPKIMHLQFWMSNLGLIGMAIGWPLLVRGDFSSIAGPLMILSSLISFAAVILFAFNILKTVKTA